MLVIISASRRTDIPAYYSEWFLNRMQAGFAYVKNPMNPRSISRVSLARDDVDGIVFWTKNPLPMLDRLSGLDDIPYYFQYTMTSYSGDIEPNVPYKGDVLIPAFRQLSGMIGPERVIWRYDPVLITEKYTLDYHIKYFDIMAKKLEGYTNNCIFSFLDIYKNTRKQLSAAGLREMSADDMTVIAQAFSEIAHEHGMRLSTCAEAIDLAAYGIEHARCVDVRIFEKITGLSYIYAKDPNQRAECGCAPSVDIGAYNCCQNGCRYCYANYNPAIVALNMAAHDPDSPLITGIPADDDRITCRKTATSIIKTPVR